MSKEVINEQTLRTKAGKAGIGRLVVGALLVENAKVLLLRRKQEDFMGGILELPSGKVEEGETFKTALEREVGEETGLRIKTITSYLGSFDYQSASGKPTRQFNFSAEPFSGELKLSPTEHDAYQWVGPGEIGSVHVSESVALLLRSFWKTE